MKTFYVVVRDRRPEEDHYLIQENTYNSSPIPHWFEVIETFESKELAEDEMKYQNANAEFVRAIIAAWNEEPLTKEMHDAIAYFRFKTCRGLSSGATEDLAKFIYFSTN